MRVEVMYPDGRRGSVEVIQLNRFISNREISRFKRAEGWVSIDSPRLRENGNSLDYIGPERRHEAIIPVP